MRKALRTAAALTVAGSVVAGCGAQVQTPTEPSGAPVTVTNCGAPLTVRGVPDRVVTNDTGITEMMFALGLGDRMAGYTVGAGQRRDVESSPWRADFDATESLGTAFTREVVTAARPDMVFAGWNYGFRESTGVTPDWIRSIGAVPYQLTEACRQPGTSQRGIMRPLDALYADLDNLGRIFGIEDRARRLIATYRAEVAAARTGAPAPDRAARVFLFDSADPTPLTSGRTAAPDQIIAEAGGRNIFADLDDSWTSTSWEIVAQRDPEVIVIVDYGSGPQNTVDAKIRLLESQPLMARTTAVRDRRYVSLPYAALVEGPRNPASVTTLARYLRSIGR
ncbi:ABC transporter substrate-binding protein [Gordonia sinesedis]